MDDLVHHILRDLSFDGDLGCDVSRLEDFIREFYQKSNAQTVDEDFCAFFWSVIVQEPTVRVGVLPKGEHTEVYVPPQVGIQRKARKKGEDVIGEPVAALTVIPDAATRSLEDLKKEYGDNLRIAVDPETSFAAITGSHIRAAKLTPMVYSALQLITRGREKGISVVELGKKTQYDQKTCFYLVKQLESLDFVVKIRQAGVGTHFCMHKHFYERSDFWKAVRDEEAFEASPSRDDDGMGQTDEPESAMQTRLHFDNIDSRHLSSLPLLRGRVVKLLSNSANHMHPSQNLLVTLGFQHPTKTDRRFFSVRLGELIKEGLIEKVLVPSSNKKRIGDGKVPCIRLVQIDDAEKREQEKDGIEVIHPETAVDDDEADDDKEIYRLKTNIAIHRQIIDLLGTAGPRGMTLTEISRQLCDFDRRTIELLLQRLEKSPPPAHLRDLGVTVVTETHGRERRNRYFSYQSYKTLLEREDFGEADALYSSIDLSQCGGFLPISSEQFYESEDQLYHYQDTFRAHEDKRKGKNHAKKNPILADGTVKRGRPRKDQSLKNTEKGTPTARKGTSKKRKRNDVEDEEENTETPAAKKSKGTVPAVPADVPSQTESSSRKARGGLENKRPIEEPEEAVIPPPKKRGRPKKPPVSKIGTQDVSIDESVHDKDASTITPQGQQADVSTTLTSQTQGLPSASTDMSAHNEAVPIEVDKTVTLSTQTMFPDFASLQPLSGLQDDSQTLQNSTSPDVTASPLNNPGKRSLDDAAAGPPSKRLKLSASSTRKTNVSHLRRDNELFRVIQDFGGITVVNVKEFVDAHVSLIERLTSAGEPTSAPIGTRLDRRTVDQSMQKLESDCRIKVVKTYTSTTTGISRTLTIAHVFDMEQAKVSAFIAGLAKIDPFGHVPPKVKQLDSGVQFGNLDLTISSGVFRSGTKSDRKHRSRSAKISQDVPLFEKEESSIHDFFQREAATISQSYGYIMGKIARARELHLHVLDYIENGGNNPHIVSREHRIFHLSYFFREISISTYCGLISVPARMEALDELLQTEQGKDKLLRDLPPSIYTGLGISASRCRSRFLDLLDLLRALGLAVALEPSESDAPAVTCVENGDHPTSFDSISPENSAAYWKFNVSTSIRLWSLSENDAPVWKDVPVSSHADGTAYWEDLHKASSDSKLASTLQASPNSSTEIVSGASGSIGRSLRRKAAWKTSYSLSWHQERYLHQFKGDRPLDDEDGGIARLNHIAWIICASEAVVRDFYLKARERMVAELGKARRRLANKQPVKVASNKKSLAKKAAERKIQRQQDWDALVARLHPEPVKKPLLTRFKRIRDEFLKAASITDFQKWERDVRNAMHEADLANRKALPRRPNLPPAPPVATSSVPLDVTGSLEKSIEELISQQGTYQNVSEPPKRKKKKKSENGQFAESGCITLADSSTELPPTEDTSRGKRRCRFVWTREYDELAKDGSVIIKARCRSGQRMDWTAIGRVFPGLPRNSVRQRIDRLSKEPGVESYLRRLEDKWFAIWMKHRGTNLLPDPEPLSMIEFDLVNHLKFLRAHIDKEPLRVGFSSLEVDSHVQLPSTVEALLFDFDTSEKTTSGPPWDFAWSSATEEGREKHMFSQAFFVNGDQSLSAPAYDSESLHVAEAAVKLVFGTPNESYEYEIGSALFHRVGEEGVSTTIANLLKRGVLSKLVRDPKKSKPGRTLKISETNLNAVGGSLSREIFQDASSFEELFLEEQSAEETEWRDWPLVASDGDMAALVEMVSANKIDFKIDTSQAHAARVNIEWNSKKADDDDIETGIQVHVRDLSWMEIWPDTDVSPNTQLEVHSRGSRTELLHGRTWNDEPACCRKETSGIVDCQACFESQLEAFKSSLDNRETETVDSLINALNESGSTGIPKNAILCINLSGDVEIFSLVEKMSKTPIPLVFWVGHVSVALISALTVQPWTVAISENPLKRVFPRRWVDIKGMKMVDVWEAALRAVIGVVIFRPGIVQSELRWRLRSVYDRSEINDLLRYLRDEGFIVARSKFPANGVLDEEEEAETSLFLGDRHWYHV